jgi:hypothetical protein
MWELGAHLSLVFKKHNYVRERKRIIGYYRSCSLTNALRGVIDRMEGRISAHTNDPAVQNSGLPTTGTALPDWQCHAVTVGSIVPCSALKVCFAAVGELRNTQKSREATPPTTFEVLVLNLCSRGGLILACGSLGSDFGGQLQGRRPISATS